MGFGSGYVVGWGTLALINAALAQGKGRSGMNWFLASLALGPIATLAIVAIGKVEVPSVRREPPAVWVQVVSACLVLLAIVLGVLGRH
jgi:hypothetical protein